MKGGIACSVAAVLQYLADNGGKPKGSISFLITGDEEDISVNGTIKLLKWCAERGEKFDHCVLGEPSQCRGARRLHQDRPPRLAVRHALCRRRAGPRRLSAPRRQSGAGYFAADRGALRRAARSRQRAVPGVESRIHLGRCRQHRQQCDPRPGARKIQHPLQRQPHPGDAARAGRGAAGESLRQPHPRPHRVGAFQLQRVRDQTRRLHRSRGQRDRGSHRPQAGTLDLAAAPRMRASSRAIAR